MGEVVWWNTFFDRVGVFQGGLEISRFREGSGGLMTITVTYFFISFLGLSLKSLSLPRHHQPSFLAYPPPLDYTTHFIFLRVRSECDSYFSDTTILRLVFSCIPQLPLIRLAFLPQENIRGTDL